MRLNIKQKHLAAEYVANIGVAWFVAGVIGPFVSPTKRIEETLFSIAWGSIISVLFLLSALYLLRKKK